MGVTLYWSQDSLILWRLEDRKFLHHWGTATLCIENIYGGMRTGIFLGLIGYAYQWTTNRNMNNSLLPHRDNPNMPIGFFEKQWQFFNIPGGAARFQYGRTLHEDL